MGGVVRWQPREQIGLLAVTHISSLDLNPLTVLLSLLFPFPPSPLPSLTPPPAVGCMFPDLIFTATTALNPSELHTLGELWLLFLWIPLALLLADWVSHLVEERQLVWRMTSSGRSVIGVGGDARWRPGRRGMKFAFLVAR